ncbi:hypothetical protein SeMB42_g01816 [Synchytrium endobioticum]|uniref:Uncharacterized protein n=1 Tax=Synchytrium endobioticum TaxID=286115 RepID=A0A507DJF5_9FUNG|nr:hypothetical protein SeMB42_g01816 [Synchytrium endobioticum]
MDWGEPIRREETTVIIGSSVVSSSPVNLTSDKRLRTTSRESLHHNMSTNIIAVLLLLLVGSFKHADAAGCPAAPDNWYPKALESLDAEVVEWNGNLGSLTNDSHMDHRDLFRFQEKEGEEREVARALNYLSCQEDGMLRRLEYEVYHQYIDQHNAYISSQVEYDEWMSPLFLLYVKKLNVLLAKSCQVWSAQAYAFRTADGLDLTAAERKQLELASEAAEKRATEHYGLANYYSIIAHGIPWPNFMAEMNTPSVRLETITVCVAIVEREFQKVQQGIWQEEQSDLERTFNLLRTSDYSWEMFMLPPRPGMELEVLEVGAKVYYIMASHLYRHSENSGQFRHVTDELRGVFPVLCEAYNDAIERLHGERCFPNRETYDWEAPTARVGRADSGSGHFNTFTGDNHVGSSAPGSPGSSRNSLSHDGAGRRDSRGAGSSKSIGH